MRLLIMGKQDDLGPAVAFRRRIVSAEAEFIGLTQGGSAPVLEGAPSISGPAGADGHAWRP